MAVGSLRWRTCYYSRISYQGRMQRVSCAWLDVIRHTKIIMAHLDNNELCLKLCHTSLLNVWKLSHNVYQLGLCSFFNWTRSLSGFLFFSNCQHQVLLIITHSWYLAPLHVCDGVSNLTSHVTTWGIFVVVLTNYVVNLTIINLNKLYKSIRSRHYN